MQALVLSAGAMFGAYQAGAWSVLSPVWRPGMIVGASVGALNGWMIAGGIAPDDLIKLWLDPRMAELMRLGFPWRPLRGVFRAQAIERLARELAEKYRPQIPYFATVTEVPRLRLRLLRGEEITFRHLLAVCAVPMGYPPVCLDDRTYVDGGLLTTLPLAEAAGLGATEILAVDCMPRLPSRLIRAAVHGAHLIARPPMAAPMPGIPVQMIAPAAPLGTLRDAVRWDPRRAREWVDLGARDAARVLASSPA